MRVSGGATGSARCIAGLRSGGFVSIGVITETKDIGANPRPDPSTLLVAPQDRGAEARPAMDERPGMIEIDLPGGTRPRVDAFVNERALRRVDCLDPGAVDGEQFTAEQVQLPAKQNELPEDRAEGITVVPPEIGNGLEVWLQMPQQPDHFDVAVGFCFQSTA